MTAENRSNSIVNQIDQLLAEVSTLAASASDSSVFFSTLLQRVCLAVDARAAAIWMSGPGASPVPVSSVRVDEFFKPEETKAASQVSRAIADCIESNLPKKLSATRKAKNDGPAGATVFLWPFKSQDKVDSAVAIYFDSKIEEDAAHVYLSFAEAIAEIAADFNGRNNSGHSETSQQNWINFKSFSDSLHESLEIKSTAKSLVNSGRRFYGCDRVLLAQTSGGSCKVIAATGAANVNRKSKTVKSLEALVAKAFYRNSKPVVFHGSQQPPSNLAAAFSRYQSVSGCEFLMLAPVSDASGNVRFVQVVESKSTEDIQRIIQHVTASEKQTGSALCNALKHQAIPMRGLLSALGGSGTGSLPGKAFLPLAALALLAVCIACLCLFQTELTVTADGTLVPGTERVIFASTDGVVQKIHTQHGTAVREDQLLVELTSIELESKTGLIEGQIATEKKKLDAIEALKNSLNRDSPDWERDLGRLSSEEIESGQRIANLQDQLDALKLESSALKLHSPITGTVVTLDPEARLTNRPVRQGDALLRVIADDGKWFARIRVPDTRLAHLSRGSGSITGEIEGDSEIPVRLLIATHPTDEFTGTVQDISRTAEVDPQTQESFVIVSIEINNASGIQLQPGASVIAKFDCGQTSYGYAHFNELIDSLRYRFFQPASE